MKRIQLLERLYENIEKIQLPHPIRVAIDGIDASGKTKLAVELAAFLEGEEKHTIRASIDDFHNPRHVRYRQGVDSSIGYFQDSFNYQALISHLLEPLGPKGDLIYKPVNFNFQTNTPAETQGHVALVNAILLFDGVFLLRPELVDYWDYKIFIDVSFDTCLQRAIERDTLLFSSESAVIDRYKTRYIPGQCLYIKSCKPRKNADVVIKNDDPKDPRILD